MFHFRDAVANHNWQGHMRVQLCHTRRCQNTFTIGGPLCSEHMREEFGVEIRPSTIAQAGQGVFTTRDICKGTHIIPYTGEHINVNEYEHRYGVRENSIYVLEGFNETYIDSSLIRSTAALCNTQVRENGTRTAYRRCNAEFDMPEKSEQLPESLQRYRHNPWVVAKRAISAGEEIFVSYGDDYVVGLAGITYHTRLEDYRCL